MTVYVGELQVEASDPAKALIRAVNRLHPTLQWRVADILMYQPQLREPSSYPNLTWCGDNEWADESASSSDEDEQEHAKRPVVLAPKSWFGPGPFIHVAFDGGSRNSEGTAGYVIGLSNGFELRRTGIYLGPNHTVNDAEVVALQRALRAVVHAKNTGNLPDLPIRVLGDSQLIMRFMLRIYRQPRKPFLYEVVQDVRKLIKNNNLRVAFRHVPRRLNSIPDAMCRAALAGKQDISYFEGALPEGAEPLNVSTLYEAVEADATQDTIRRDSAPAICAAWAEHLRGKPCAECHSVRGEADMVVCDRCEECYHIPCADHKGYSPVH